MRALVALGVCAVVLAASAASAATLGVAGDALGAGSTTVASCDTGGVTLTWATTAGKVSSVTVAGLADPGCDGARVELAATAAGARIASATPATVPADGDTADASVTLAVPGLPAPDLIDGARVLLSGP